MDLYSPPRIEKIIISNFGPIKHGELDLRNFSVFLGVNDIGKSYSAKLYYALLKSFHNAYLALFVKSLDSLISVSLENYLNLTLDPSAKYPISISNTPSQDLTEMIERLNDELLPLKSFTDTLLNLPPDDTLHDRFESLSSHLIQKLLPHSYIGNLLEDLISKEFRRLFPLEVLLNHRWRIQITLSSSLSIFLSPNISGKLASKIVNLEYIIPDTLRFNIYVDVFPNIFHFEFGITPENKISPRLDVPRHLQKKVDLFTQLVDWQLFIFTKFFIFPKEGIQPPFYLPASRSGLIQSYQLVTTLLMGNLDSIVVYGKQVPSYSGEVQDFLQLILTSALQKQFKSRKKYNKIGEDIERDVLEGQIVVEEDGYQKEIYFIKKNRRYRLRHTSSIVSELSALILLLKSDLLRENTTLILEEPESHLHPSAQIKLVKALIELKNCGINVILTTHSPTFVDKIMAQVIATELHVDKGEKQRLSKEETQFISFRQDDGGTITQNVMYDELTHSYSPDFFQDAMEDIIKDLEDTYQKAEGAKENDIRPNI